MKILIIKLGAMGDVLRTTPLLAELKRNYPASKISWLVEAQSRPVLEKNPLIDALFTYSDQNILALKRDHFDLSVNLDKEPEAIDAMMAIPSKKRLGFGRSSEGRLCALDRSSVFLSSLCGSMDFWMGSMDLFFPYCSRGSIF